MTDLLQAVVNGIASGSVYAVLALSIALIFSTMGAVNFAAGSMGAVSAYLLYLFGTTLALGWVVGVVFALAGAVLIGVAVERGIVRPLGSEGGESALFRLVLATMGLDILLNNLTQHGFGASVRNVGLPLPDGAITFGGVGIDAGRLVIFVVAVVGALSLAYVLRRTTLGTGLRAYAQDPMAAILMGIPARTVSRWTWVISSLLGGVAAILVAAVTTLSIGYLQPSFLQAMTAAVLGGLASLPGAVAGAFVLGIVEALSITYAPSVVTAILPLVVVIAVLMIRPSGLFGRSLAQRA
jgi:branched-chain amino acid transport system permease protein